MAKGRKISLGKQKEGAESVASKKAKKESAADSNIPATTATNMHQIYRKQGHPWVGAHVSVAKGLFQAAVSSTELNANAFALFLKNQRRWDSKPLTPKDITKFKETCCSHGFDGSKILPHGSYLINLGNPNEEKRSKSLESFVDDLQRCEQLGIDLYNFHPGSTVGECSKAESIKNIAKCINISVEKTSKVIIVLENMAGQGHVVGSKFEELAEIISLVHEKDRVGVCLDTCHLFAAGYDIRTAESFNKVMEKFDKIVGLKYLKGMHLNDSKGDLGDCKDRHENIGKGKIGMECFRFIMNDPRFRDIPMVLETPLEDEDTAIYCDEIKLLYSLIKS